MQVGQRLPFPFFTPGNAKQSPQRIRPRLPRCRQSPCQTRQSLGLPPSARPESLARITSVGRIPRSPSGVAHRLRVRPASAFANDNHAAPLGQKWRARIGTDRQPPQASVSPRPQLLQLRGVSFERSRRCRSISLKRSRKRRLHPRSAISHPRPCRRDDGRKQQIASSPRRGLRAGSPDAASPPVRSFLHHLGSNRAVGQSNPAFCALAPTVPRQRRKTRATASKREASNFRTALFSSFDLPVRSTAADIPTPRLHRPGFRRPKPRHRTHADGAAPVCCSMIQDSEIVKCPSLAAISHKTTPAKADRPAPPPGAESRALNASKTS